MGNPIETLTKLAETSKDSVVVLGSRYYKEEIMGKIKSRLVDNGYAAFAAVEITRSFDEHFTPRQRIYWFLANSCFVIAEDSVPSGQMVELEYCKNIGVSTAILYDKNLPRSSWMTLDMDIHCSDFKCFCYDRHKDGNLEETVDNAIKWAKKRNKDKQNEFSNKAKEWEAGNNVFNKPEVIDALTKLKNAL
ncbi:MAG: hypothetical protein ABIF85_06105 [Nanoarchaeota archaeon]